MLYSKNNTIDNQPTAHSPNMLRLLLFTIGYGHIGILGFSIDIQPPSNSPLATHPLSDLLILKENLTTEYHHYPLPPACSQFLDVDSRQFSVTATIWKMDTRKAAAQGVLVWSEHVTTSCTFGFWGSKTKVTTGIQPIAAERLPNFEEIAHIFGKPENEAIELDHIDDSLRFYCYYCRNDYPGSYNRLMAKHVVIYNYADGSVSHPQGDWVKYGTGIYWDKFRYLMLLNDSETSCPFKIYNVKPASLSFTRRVNPIISIPTTHQQFTLTHESKSVICTFDSIQYRIYQSSGGYLLSVSSEGLDPQMRIQDLIYNSTYLVRNRRSLRYDRVLLRLREFLSIPISIRHLHKRSLRLSEFDSSLRTSMDYAQLRYEQDFIVTQINKNLEMLQKTICDFNTLRWNQLSPPDLPRKVAQYISGTNYALGEESNGMYKIVTTTISSRRWQIPLPLTRKRGMFKVVDVESNHTYWVEPVTGILFENATYTHFSTLATWLPAKNNSGVDLITGKLYKTESDQQVLNPISRPRHMYRLLFTCRASYEAWKSRKQYTTSQATPHQEVASTM